MLERSHKSLLYTRWSFSTCYLVMFAANEESELCSIDQLCVRRCLLFAARMPWAV